nr:M20/M25/M40 family metallo-hydrolase [Aliamphritea spongicola]
MSLDQNLISRMTEWRQHLHRFPECGFDLPLTADFIAERLTEFGIEVTRNIGQQGIVGVLKCGDGANSIGLRADMDALFIHEENQFEHRSRHDGQMHACGHDGHSAMLLGLPVIWRNTGILTVLSILFSSRMKSMAVALRP